MVYRRPPGSFAVLLAMAAAASALVACRPARAGEPVPHLGLEVAELTATQAQPQGGVFIKSIEPNGPGAQAGLAPGDILVQLGRSRVSGISGLKTALARITVGKPVDVVYLRKGETYLTTLTPTPTPAKPIGTPSEPSAPEKPPPKTPPSKPALPPSQLPEGRRSPQPKPPMGNPTILFSDSFDRADAGSFALGRADLALGGRGNHFYIPVGSDGARIVGNVLENGGRDFGGVQFAAQPGGRGENTGEDLNIKVDLFVPIDAASHVTQAGPYFRSRAAAGGDGLIGGTSAGFWVQLHSNGKVRVKRLNPQMIVASTGILPRFDPRVFHTMEIAAQGNSLQVALDGRLLSFQQGGKTLTSVRLVPAWEGPPPIGVDQGTAGIFFGAEDNRGAIGGQKADNLVVSAFHPLVVPPTPTSPPDLPPVPGPPAGAPHVLTNSIGMQFALIPAGEFVMGNPDWAGNSTVNNPPHPVRITRPFYLGIHEVTVGDFKEFVRETFQITGGGSGYDPQGERFVANEALYNWQSPGWPQTDRHPVVNVSWFDAAAFCRWLSKKEGKNYRLPTEAEWEYACRAGTTTYYWSGNDPATLEGAANVADASLKRHLAMFRQPGVHDYTAKWDDGFPFTAPVGSFRPNRFGLFDMHGNAQEWCADWYDKDYYRHSPRDDPQGPPSGQTRVKRGGDYIGNAVSCRSAVRGEGMPPAPRTCFIGFRAACQAEGVRAPQPPGAARSGAGEKPRGPAKAGKTPQPASPAAPDFPPGLLPVPGG